MLGAVRSRAVRSERSKSFRNLSLYERAQTRFLSRASYSHQFLRFYASWAAGWAMTVVSPCPQNLWTHIGPDQSLAGVCCPRMQI